MKLEVKQNCPLNGFEPCKQFDCAWFISVKGMNPQTEQEVDDWGCAVAWMPILQINTTMHQAQTGAAVESFRNEMVKSNQVSQQVLLAAANVNKDMKVIGDGNT